jgi:hypothetical protein
MKAILFPSGDQRGLKSALGFEVNRQARPPAAGMTQISLLLAFRFLSISVMTKAMSSPLGEI